MRDRMELLNDQSLWNPEVVHMACGHSVPNVGNVEVFNYYDMKRMLTRVADRPDVDTSGQLPNGVTYWFDSVIDGSRAICLACAKRKGWLKD